MSNSNLSDIHQWISDNYLHTTLYLLRLFSYSATAVFDILLFIHLLNTYCATHMKHAVWV